MVLNDVVGVALVYIYVVILLLTTEKVLKRFPMVNRKVLHIMTGNIAFLLPIFQTRWVMAFIAAAPFIVLTFLMSPYSPVKSLRGKTSAAGHGLGLVYYAISWTVLAFVFFEQKELIAVGILAMSYGDGMASIIGTRLGRRKYQVFGDEKSIMGSVAMLVFTFVACSVGLVFYAVMDGAVLSVSVFGALLVASVVATLVEAVTPWGLDNLSVPLVTAGVFWYSLGLL